MNFEKGKITFETLIDIHTGNPIVLDIPDGFDLDDSYVLMDLAEQLANFDSDIVSSYEKKKVFEPRLIK